MQIVWLQIAQVYTITALSLPGSVQTETEVTTELVCHGVQTEVTTDDKSIQFPEPRSADVRIDAVSRLSEAAQQAGYSLDSDSLSSFVSNGSVSLQSVGTFHMHNSSCSWTQYYPVLTFLLNGYLHADYFDCVVLWVSHPVAALSGTESSQNLKFTSLSWQSGPVITYDNK